MSEAPDILIRGGTVLDGTGADACRADIVVSNGRIAAVGAWPGAPARTVIDASGLIVCPGFIDVHSHSDAYLLVDPDASSKTRQGVTTEIVGQCGCSGAPILGEAQLPSDWRSLLTSAGVPLPESPEGSFWHSVAAYRERLAATRHGPNVMLLAGHNMLRAGVLGYAPRAASEAECVRMARLLAQAMDEGASGFSTGLIYQPGRNANAAEVSVLVAEVAARGGIYASHIRSEGARLLEALDEVLDVGRRTGARVQVSHLKTSGRANWHKLDDALERIASARAGGLCVHADRYPYLASGTDLDVLLPDWAASGGSTAVLTRLSDAAAAARVAAEIDAGRSVDYWPTVMLGATWHAQTHPWRGRTLDGIAAAWDCTPGEVIVRVLAFDELRTGAFFFGMSEANLVRIYAQPWVMVGSDASLRAIGGVLGSDHPHPRAYGTFPRFLRLALDGQSGLSLPEAVRRVTSLPAAAFGLPDRGRIAPGARADLVLFDPDALGDPATYAQPHQYATGVRWTLVNGVVAFDGRRSVARPGCWLQAAPP